MAKLIEYDVTGVESGGGGTGVKVKPGVHVARVMKCTHRTENRAGNPANDLEVALNVGEEYDWVFTYIGLSEASDWKLAEFVRAIGLKDKGKINPDKITSDKPVIRVKINTGTYDGNYSPDAGRLMPAQPGDEDLIGKSVSELSSRNGDEPQDDEASQGGGPHAGKEYPDGYEPWREGEEREGETVASYDDWTDDDLEGEVSDRGLTVPGGRGSKKGKIITALRADDAEAAGADDGDDGDDNQTAVEASQDGDDYDEWDVDKLKTEWEEREMGELPVIKGRNAEARLQAKLIEELRADDKANPFEG